MDHGVHARAHAQEWVWLTCCDGRGRSNFAEMGVSRRVAKLAYALLFEVFAAEIYNARSRHAGT